MINIQASQPDVRVSMCSQATSTIPSQLPQQVSGNTGSSMSKILRSCRANANTVSDKSYALSYAFTPMKSDSISIDTTLFTDFDTVVSIFADTPTSCSQELACNDDAYSGGPMGSRGSYIRISLVANKTYRIVVSGYDDRSIGNFQLQLGNFSSPVLVQNTTRISHGLCYLNQPTCTCDGGWTGPLCDQMVTLSKTVGWVLAILFIFLLVILPCGVWRYRKYRAGRMSLQHEGIGAKYSEKDSFQLGQI